MKISRQKLTSIEQAKKLLKEIGADNKGVEIMAPKMLFYCFKVEDISSYAANIVKQHMLSLGSDAAISRDSLVKKIKTSILIYGSKSQIEKLILKLKNQPFGLKELAAQLKKNLNNKFAKKKFIARGKSLSFNNPVICAIVNATTDSFSNDGIYQSKNYKVSDNIISNISGMISAGAKIVDIGGESTRPFSQPVKEDVEIKRVVPLIKVIRKKFPKVIISVDTYKYKVAKEAVSAGADVINDITALKHSKKMVSLVKQYNLGVVLMHMQETPKTMQVKPQYKDLMRQISLFLEERVEFCLKHGISKNQIMVDPGIGFGKTVEHNLTILNSLYMLNYLQVPIFVGLSKKSFIGKILRKDVDKRVIGTVAALVSSYINGADVLRVHDVKEAKEALTIAARIKKCRNF